MRSPSFLLALLLATNGWAARLNPRAYGAMGDGQHIDSDAINAALLAAAAEGDTVTLDAGTYLCYSIHLQSGVTLQLERGAVIKAAPVTATEGYDHAEANDSRYQDFGHSHWHNSLIWGEGLHDVTLEGEGLIDGSGVLTRGGERKSSSGQTTANKALALRNCQRVNVRGVSFRACGHFAILFTGVDDVLIDGVTADTNRDGFDIDCCEHVVIRNCRVNTVNDDAIVLKCSYALGWAKPTAHVVIEDCHVSGFDVGSLLDGTRTTATLKAPDGDGPTGRIKLGTESNGGFRHIVIRRCTFTHCRGLALETVDGATMEDIDVSELTMTDICNPPLYIRLGNRMRGPEGLHPSVVKNIHIRNISATEADSRYAACLIVGTEGHPIRDVSISDFYVQAKGGLTLDDFRQQRGANPFFFEKIRQTGQGGVKLYPEPAAHGLQPSWGISIQHARDIKMRNVRLEAMQKDERLTLYTDDVKRVRFRRVSVSHAGVIERLR